MAQVTFTMKNIPPAATGTAGNMYYNSTNNELYIANANGTYGNAIGGDWVTLESPIRLYNGSTYPWAEHCSTNSISPTALWVRFSDSNNANSGIQLKTLYPRANFDTATTRREEGLFVKVPSKAFGGSTTELRLVTPLLYFGPETQGITMRMGISSVTKDHSKFTNIYSYRTFTTSTDTVTDVTGSIQTDSMSADLARSIYIVAYKRG